MGAGVTQITGTGKWEGDGLSCWDTRLRESNATPHCNKRAVKDPGLFTMELLLSASTFRINFDGVFSIPGIASSFLPTLDCTFTFGYLLYQLPKHGEDTGERHRQGCQQLEQRYHTFGSIFKIHPASRVRKPMYGPRPSREGNS